MTPHQTLAITVRLFALWLFLFAATTVASNYFYARDHGLQLSPSFAVISAVVVALFCWLIWSFPLFIAKKILPASSESTTHSPVFESWFSVGCSLIGLFALSKSIPALVSYFVINYMGLKLYPTTFQVNPDWRLHVAFNFLQLFFGIWLFLGGKGLRKILMWARNV